LLSHHWSRRSSLAFLFFFFQAEDGIRAPLVTGVQTCALPISSHCGSLTLPIETQDLSVAYARRHRNRHPTASWQRQRTRRTHLRSEERRVGKGGRARGAGCSRKAQSSVRTGGRSVHERGRRGR